MWDLHIQNMQVTKMVHARTIRRWILSPCTVCRLSCKNRSIFWAFKKEDYPHMVAAMLTSHDLQYTTQQSSMIVLILTTTAYNITGNYTAD